VVTDGFMTAIQPGSYLIVSGIMPDAEADAAYSCRFRNCILWPYDEDGNLLGEEFYFSGFVGSNFRKLADEEVPENYRAYIA
jgi:hypothetical protein